MRVPILSKLLSAMTHPGGGMWRLFGHTHPRESGSYDYQSRIGTGQRVSVLMAPIQFIQRAMPEAPLVVERGVDDEFEVVPDHPAAELLARPNAFYSGFDLLSATLFSYLTDGNAYWGIVRNRQGRPLELWWIPHWMITPAWPDDGSAFISHYRYRPKNEIQELDPADVVHFRHGINPDNPRKGVSPVASVIRDMWVDEEASEFIAALLRNQGVPGLVISPDNDEPPSPEDAEAFKRYMREEFGGTMRGNTLVASGKTKVDRVGFSPHDMDLTAVTDRPEERVCALLGIPAAVVGFAAGLEQTKVGATMEELRRLAWTNGIIPIQRVFADELNRSLLPLFRRQRGNVRIRFDRSEVAALAEDRNALVDRVDKAVKGGWMSVAQAKRTIGIEPEATDEVYLRPISMMTVPVGRAPQRPPADGGNGDGDDDDAGKAATVVTVTGERLSAAQAQALAAKAEHDPFEERIAAEAPRREHNRSQRTFMRAQEEIEPRLRDTMGGELIDEVFAEIGRRAAREAQPVLDDELKQAAQDQTIVDRVVDAMAMSEITDIFREVHERHYLRVAEATAANMEVLGLATDLPDPVARAVVATAGRRAGLVDLTAQTKRAMFRALEAGRAEGEGVDQLVRRIRDGVPAGPWSTPDVRARVIARTETKHAQRTSVIENARAQDIQQFIIFDARLGETDAACMELDGRVVSAEEAEHLMSLEHPNGTRDAVPHFGD